MSFVFLFSLGMCTSRYCNVKFPIGQWRLGFIARGKHEHDLINRSLKEQQYKIVYGSCFVSEFQKHMLPI